MSNEQIQKEAKQARAQGVPEDVIANFIEVRRAQMQDIPMSQQDSVVISSREGNVPGTYIDEYQKSQDQYGQMLIMQDLAARQQQTAARELERSQSLPVSMYGTNPNVRVESEGQNVAVGPNGSIIYY